VDQIAFIFRHSVHKKSYVLVVIGGYSCCYFTNLAQRRSIIMGCCLRRCIPFASLCIAVVMIASMFCKVFFHCFLFSCCSFICFLFSSFLKLVVYKPNLKLTWRKLSSLIHLIDRALVIEITCLLCLINKTIALCCIFI
jgi:hypothetical protein